MSLPSIPHAVASPYRWYQEQLACLAAKLDPVIPVVREAGAQQGWWNTDTAWVRTYGRFQPSQAPYCVLVYETAGVPQRLCLTEVFAERPSLSDVLCRQDPVLGWLRLSLFPFDPQLDTLAQVYSSASHTHVVRYRPYQRCTLRVEAQDRIRFAKVFKDERGKDLYRAGVDLWNAAVRGELEFKVAQPDRWDPATKTLWQHELGGVPAVPRLFGANGCGLARRMGRACATLSGAALRPAVVLDHRAQLNRTINYMRVIRAHVPDLAGILDDLYKTLVQCHDKLLEQPLRPIHGAPHPQQWLESETCLALVDFDRFCLGDPEFDVATFLAEMDFEGSTQVPADKLNEAFMAGYESCYGPLDQKRVQLYRAHKRLGKVQRVACALRPDAPARATQHMQRVWDCLQGGD